MGLISRVSSRTYRNLILHIPKKENMAYFSQNNDEHYKAYYKPKQAPGGTSSISFGDDTPVSTHKKQGANPDCPKTAAQLEKENSRPNSERSAHSDSRHSERQDSGCRKTAAQIERESREAKEQGVNTTTKQQPTLPKENDIFGGASYGDRAPKNTKSNGYRVVNPPGGKSSGPLW